MAQSDTITLVREPPFRLGGAQVSPATRELRIGDDRHVLEPRVMQVLTIFARRPGEVLSRDDLIAACWDGRVVSEDAINRVISKIHRLAALDGAGFSLETIRGVGYRLNVEPPASIPAETPDPSSAEADAPTARPKAVSRRVLATTLLLALAVVLAGGGWLAWRARPATAAAPAAEQPVTLAVLPFQSLTLAPENAFLADGLTTEVRNRVARLRGLRVIAQSSSSALADQNLSATELGRRLGADWLLNGSVRQAGDAVRVTAELVDARSGLQVWQDTREGAAAQIFGLQDGLSAAVLQELVGRLGPDRVQTLAPARPRDPAAYRLALQAEQLVQDRTTLVQQGRSEAAQDAGERAWTLANQALAADPEEPRALLALAKLHGGGMTRALAAQPLTASERGSAAAAYARRALAADPNEPAALTTLAEHLRRDGWRWRESEALFRRALAVDPNQADAHTWYAYLLSTVGRCEEGLTHARAAAALDPAFVWRRLAEPRLLTCLGRNAEADRLYAAAMARDPDNLFLLQEVYLKRLTEADPARLRALEQEARGLWRDRPPPPAIEAVLARMTAAADALEGRPERLLAMVEADVADRSAGAAARVSRRASDVDWTFAMEFAWAGRPGRALDLLETAVAGGSLYIPDTLPYGARPFTAAVRADPRWAALWRSEPRLVELMELRRRALGATL